MIAQNPPRFPPPNPDLWWCSHLLLYSYEYMAGKVAWTQNNLSANTASLFPGFFRIFIWRCWLLVDLVYIITYQLYLCLWICKWRKNCTRDEILSTWPNNFCSATSGYRRNSGSFVMFWYIYLCTLKLPLFTYFIMVFQNSWKNI